MGFFSETEEDKKEGIVIKNSKSAKIRLNIVPKLFRHSFKIVPKSFQNSSHIVPKSATIGYNSSKLDDLIRQKSANNFETVPKSIVRYGFDYVLILFSNPKT